MWGTYICKQVEDQGEVIKKCKIRWIDWFFTKKVKAPLKYDK